MAFKEKKHYRYKGYDYSGAGMYFVTICTLARVRYFGTVRDDAVVLSPIGRAVHRYWLEIPRHFYDVVLDAWVIMPDHIHGIIFITDDTTVTVGTGQCPVPVEPFTSSGTGQCPVPTRNGNVSTFGHVTPHSLSTIIGSFKSISTKMIHRTFSDTDFAWQSRFYDRIIRTERELKNVRDYIYYNPAKWHANISGTF